jgi:hypothetical protein
MLAWIPIAMGLVLAGCGSNLYPSGPIQPLSSRHPGGRAFVRNPELSEEFQILEASGIFEIVRENEASKSIELHPRKTGAACGNPLLLTWATFGLMPATVSITSTFSFTIKEKGVVSEREFVLEGERRVSLLQPLFKPFRSDTRTWGAILASEYEQGR